MPGRRPEGGPAHPVWGRHLVLLATTLALLVAAGLATVPVTGAQTDPCSEAACADLSVTKSDDPDPVTAGEQLTYTVTVTNQGPDFAPDVDLIDDLPDSVSFIDWASTQGTCALNPEGDLECDLGDMCPQADSGCEVDPTQVTVTITVVPNTPGTITNVASAESTSDKCCPPGDPDPSDDTASEDTTVLAPLTLDPPSATNPVGTAHTVTATLSSNSEAVPNEQILFSVGGANSAAGSDTTDAKGQATFTYTGNNAGQDTITACWDRNANEVCDAGPGCDCIPERTATATKTWTAYALTLAPQTDRNPVGTSHTVTATLTNAGEPVSGATVNFTVAGANPTDGSSQTNSTGKATFTYTGSNVGEDAITACFPSSQGCFASATAAKVWTPYVLALAPPTATNNTLSLHTVTATLTNDGAPTSEATVLFRVEGVHPSTGVGHTNGNGNVTFTYLGLNAGSDLITACMDRTGNLACDPGEPTATATKDWIPQCADGLDNDSDGRVDHPDDPGCSSPSDPNEADVTACSDGVDNDRDRRIDFPSDPGCSSPDDPTETFDNPKVSPGGPGSSATGATTVSPPGTTPVVVIPAHKVGHARFRVTYGRVVNVRGRRYLVLRVRGRRGHARVRIRILYRGGRTQRFTRTVATNRRVRVRNLPLSGVRAVRLTILR